MRSLLRGRRRVGPQGLGARVVVVSRGFCGCVVIVEQGPCSRVVVIARRRCGCVIVVAHG